MQLEMRTAAYLKEAPSGMVLIGTQGASDKVAQFPPAAYIHGAHIPADVEIGSSGSIYTYTVVHVGQGKVPYALAMVDFASGVRVFGRLLYSDARPPRIGDAVRVVPHVLDDGLADYAFHLA
ncbi:MAG TPA: OB-fold domain-containing protein [Pseudorhodoferax sp.]|nr:OB-fold domain-containing protein [Pseudorhodoferax sp.]